MPAISESHVSPRNGPQPGGAVFDCFRRWRERTLPCASYRIAPRLWTPAGLTYAAGLADSHRRAVKSFEPMLTGIAWTPRRFYLVVAATAPGYEHVGKLIHCAALFRADPDYAEHCGSRVSLILLADNVAPALADFARRHRVHVIAANAAPTTNLAAAPCAGDGVTAQHAGPSARP
jgi:hypothetical protein